VQSEWFGLRKQSGGTEKKKRKDRELEERMRRVWQIVRGTKRRKRVRFLSLC
jgi:hypothetical protein